LTGSLEERKKGSPNTPDFTPFRLTISRQGHPDETVNVIFRIVPDEDGRFKPWTKEFSSDFSLYPAIGKVTEPHRFDRPTSTVSLSR